MAQFHHIMFGQVLYEDGLSYQEILDAEERIRTLLQEVLSLCGATHVDFDSQADATLVECVFPQTDREFARDFCETIARRLGPGILARFLFLDRELTSLLGYFLGRGKWQEQVFTIPTPKEALSGRLITRDRSKPSREARVLDAPAPEPEPKKDSAPQAAPVQPEFDHATALRAMMDMLNRKGSVPE